PVAEENLPVVLPGAGNDNTSHAPLHQQEDFFTTTCPKCNEPARRETDTMDTFMESSWYFARYTSPNDSTTPIDRKAADYWLQVDQYIGGVEHAILHLLYSRFFTKVLRDLGYLNIDEPFRNLLTQGMVIKDGFKMSKSKGNVVDPNDLIESYGADTVRLFSLFAAPPERDLEWNAQGVEGASRFLNRLYRLIIGNIDCFSCTDEPDPLQITGADKELYRKVHQTIKRFTDAIEKNFHFNTAISSVQELFNLTSTLISNPKSSLNPAVLKASLETSLLLLSPMVPHFCEETWEVVGHTHAINQKGWPIYNPEAAKEDELTIIVQVNGKVRGKLQVPADIDNDSIQQQALTDERVTNFIGDKEVKKIIVVKKKLVNIVV
ncbi:MAG: class I tRNA ligase family protein, partial [Desulfobulbaceae bacterium]|nr:class I tRNA ligase family protein [Desulfobulbaceae bacterium]